MNFITYIKNTFTLLGTGNQNILLANRRVWVGFSTPRGTGKIAYSCTVHTVAYNRLHFAVSKGTFHL